MAIREVLRLGHPLLRERARALTDDEIASTATDALIADMTDTLHEQGGIGLAAPQIGVSIRLAIIEIVGGATRYGDLAPMPLTVFINPDIEVINPERAGYWEGCLSVPGLRGFVERPQHVMIRYTTEAGTAQQLELQGFYATVFQHEFDHLDGKLFIDRMDDTRLLAFEEEYTAYWGGSPTDEL